MDLTIKDYYNLYWGGNNVTGGAYLWRLINEPESGGTFEQRRQRASYPNFQRKIVSIYTDYVFYGKAVVENKPDRYDIESLANDIVTHSLIGGVCYVLVLDRPKVYEEWRVEVKKDGTIIISGKIGEKIIISGNTLRIEKNGFDPIIIENFDRARLFQCYWNPEKMSLIADTADINVTIYNFWSVLDTLVLHSAIFNTTGPPIGDRKKVTSFEHVLVNAGEVPFQFVSPDVSNIPMIRNEIKSRIMEMAAIVGLTREFSEELGVDASGLSLAFQMLDTNATTLQIAKSGAKCTNHAAEIDAIVNGGKAPSIQLDPLLTPQADQQKLEKFKSIEDIRINEIIKESQKQRASIVFSDLSDERQRELLDAIEREGGIESMARPELDFNI